VPISFYDLLADDGWEPLWFDQADPNFYWNDGGFMASAPVDITATLDGAMWHSTTVEPEFGWRGRRIRPGFVVPKRHHNLRQLMIVVGGSVDVEYGADEKEGAGGGEIRRIGPSEFWIAEPGVPYTMTVGPEGVTYLECWDDSMTLAETYWHDDSHWKRR
jgi:mannose-6-phosphate isomerase-like protein (cupin superfamily)